MSFESYEKVLSQFSKKKLSYMVLAQNFFNVNAKLNTIHVIIRTIENPM